MKRERCRFLAALIVATVARVPSEQTSEELCLDDDHYCSLSILGRFQKQNPILKALLSGSFASSLGYSQKKSFILISLRFGKSATLF